MRGRRLSIGSSVCFGFRALAFATVLARNVPTTRSASVHADPLIM